MQNHGLEIHYDKIGADSATKNILNILQRILGSAKKPKMFGIFKKKLSLDVRSPCTYNEYG
jgi:hypothetical protein